jgi:hypothetical protein
MINGRSVRCRIGFIERIIIGRVPSLLEPVRSLQDELDDANAKGGKLEIMSGQVKDSAGKDGSWKGSKPT